MYLFYYDINNIFGQNVQNSKLFRRAPSHILKILEEKKVLYFNHKYAVYRDLFYRKEKIHFFFWFWVISS